MPASIIGNWEVDGKDLPTQALRDKYSKWTFAVNADQSYSLKYIDKANKVTDFTGSVVLAGTITKHTSGSFMYNITINVVNINGQSAPGGWKGIYAFEPGGILKLNIEPNVGGVTAPTISGSFGSGSSGNNAVFNFVKK